MEGRKSAARGSWSRLMKVRLGKESIIVDMLSRVSGFLAANLTIKINRKVNYTLTSLL